MLVVAGAGTGKTTVLTKRIANLVRVGHARPDQILAVTYTLNAAAEMRQRIESEISKSTAAGLQICTFHAYCDNLLARAGRKFRVLDDKQLWIFLRRHIRELKLHYFVRAANTATFLNELTEFIRRCHDELVGPEQYADYVSRLERGEYQLPRVTKSKHAHEVSDEEVLDRCRELAHVFETTERLLRERNLGTFGHMIVDAHQLLAQTQEILDSERSRLRFILFDEFQDANYAQIKVVQMLAGTVANVFAVGDPDQGIYRFRGASSGAFELFQKHFSGSQLVILSRNRRSTTPILNCASAAIAQNPEFNLEAEGTQYRRASLISARDEEDGFATKRPLLEAAIFSNEAMQATDLAAVLQETHRRTRCAWKDFGILYRNHNHRDEVVAELARNGIPFGIEGMDVTDAPEVRDLLACLNATVSDDDSVALFRVAALRQFSVDPADIRQAMRNVTRESRRPLAALLPEIKGGRQLATAVSDARRVIEGHKAYAALLALIRHFEIPRNSPVNALLQFATEWEKLPITETGMPAEFMGYLADFREANGTIPLSAPAEEDAVRLMTAHSAKGLEFDHVFVLRVISNSFPTSYREALIEIPNELRNSGLAGQDEKAIHDQEERRLFYVAMTRARDTLTIYAPYGRGKDKTPPGFLRDLLKDRNLRESLTERRCREFQTTIFAEEGPPALSRVAEWLKLEPASDLAATLSATALQLYEMCPLQFKLERDWRMPGEASAPMQYGASIHRVLLTYYESVRMERALSDEQVIEEFRADLARENIADRYQHERYEEQGIAQLKEFLAASRATQPNVLHTEERFKIKIGNASLAGRIDRIDRGSGDAVVITDYKTGRPQTQDDADDSLQLSLYALAAREQWGYHVERLVLHSLDGNIEVSTTRSEKQLQAAKMKVEEIASKIASGDFTAKPGVQCGFCAYRVLCTKKEKRIPELVSLAGAGTS